MEKFNIDRFSIEDYNNFIEKIKNEIFNNDFLNRKQTLTFIVENEEIEIEKGRALINSIILRAIHRQNFPIMKRYFLFDEFIKQSTIEKYFNNLMSWLHGQASYEVISSIFYEILNELSDLSGSVNVKYGNSISFADFVELATNDKDFYDALNPQMKFGMQFNEIEAFCKQAGAKVMEIFRNHPESELYPFMTSESGINKQQFQQVTAAIGLKPNMKGQVIPVLIKDNFVKGISRVENYLIVAKGARKALTQNATQTKSSGYLARKLSLVSMDRYNDDELDDCGTKHFVRFIVDVPEKIKMIEGRHYYELDENGNKKSDLKTIDLKDDSLIGTTIGLRSPITCCSKHVCSVCYGRRLAEINRGKNTGLIACNKLTEPLTQRLLSSKHLLATKTEKINWGADFDDVFIVNMDTISFNGVEATISINCNDIHTSSEDDSELYVTELTINKKLYKTVGEIPLYLNAEVLKFRDDDSDTIEISSAEYPEGDYLFKFVPKNNEMTKSLQQILDLLETSDHLGMETYDDFINKFSDLLVQNELSWINLVHPEIISSNLIVNKKNGTRADFTKDDVDYTIARVSRSILNSPLSVSFAFERINDQLSNLTTYEKDRESIMDFLFK